MAKRPDTSVAPIYAAAELWVDRALQSDDSLFTPGQEIWSAATTEDLYQRFVLQPDESSDTFMQKFERQLTGAPAETVQLAGEMLYVYFLIARSVTGEHKREVIREVLGWSPRPVDLPAELAVALDEGLCNPGLSFNTHRPMQLWQVIEFIRAWKRLDAAEQTHLLEDPWAFKDFVFDHQVQSAQTQRYALLHLVHPESFESIVSDVHKEHLARGFPEYVDDPDADIDRQILQVRTALDSENEGWTNLYKSPLVDRWLPKKAKKPKKTTPDGGEAAGASADGAPAPDPGESAPSYWIFQANPKYYRIREAIHALPGQTWSVRRHKDEIKAGDYAYIWESGKKGGILGRAKVVSAPFEGKCSPEEIQFWHKDQNNEVETRVNIELDRVLDEPISKDAIRDAGLAGLQIFRAPQGTNYPVLPEEVAILERLLEGAEPMPVGAGDTPNGDRQVWLFAPGRKGEFWDEMHRAGEAAIGWSVGDVSHYTSIEEIRDALREPGQPEPWNSARAVYDFGHTMSPGDVVIVKEGRNAVLGFGFVTSDYRWEPDRARYQHVRNVDWWLRGHWEVPAGAPLAMKTLTNITKDEGLVQRLAEAMDVDAADWSLEGDEVGETIEPHPKVTLQEIAEVTGFEHEDLERWVRAIRRKGQGILYGPPGTGKTFVAQHLARHLVGGGTGLNEIVQFHPSYGYEDFMEGIRPATTSEGAITYRVVPGRLLRFVEDAQARDGTSVLIIDEINRANLSRVFGELMYLLEYRDQDVSLAAGRRFRIPENVILMGTMNTADRSIALVDHALRRRFAFIALRPEVAVLRRFHANTGFPVDRLIALLEDLNEAIGDPNYSVGVSFFLHEALGEHLEDVWRMEIHPYLEEYFFDQRDAVHRFSWPEVAKRLGG